MSASKENIFKTFLNDTKFRFASKHIHNQSGATTTTTKKELQFLDYNSDICILLSVLFYVFTVVIFLVSSTRAIAAMHISKQTSIFCFFFFAFVKCTFGFTRFTMSKQNISIFCINIKTFAGKWLLFGLVLLLRTDTHTQTEKYYSKIPWIWCIFVIIFASCILMNAKKG